jgi:hypothetical protein
MENNKNLLNNVIAVLLALCLGFLIDKTLGFITLQGAVIACITFAFIIAVQSYIEHNSRKAETEYLKTKVEELKKESTEIINSTINRLYLTQNNNFKTNQFSNVLNFSEVFEIEKTSKEIWIFAKNLEYEMTENALTDLVLQNLINGCVYHYLVPDNAKIRLRVKSLLLKFKKAGIPENNIKFRIKEQDLIMSFFGITIYNPTINNRVETKLDPTVVFFPDSKLLNDKEDRMFITVFGKETIEVQEDFNALWEKSKIVRLSVDENIEVEG